MSKWTKHKDWQPKPKNLQKFLPICPVCKQETKWEIYDIWSMDFKKKYRYKFVCIQCKAEWGAVPLRPFQISSGIRVLKFPNKDSIACLLNVGESPKSNTSNLLNKELKLSEWKKMAKLSCEVCGSPISEDMKFCPKCGHELC